jgi:hypothetical protein
VPRNDDLEPPRPIVPRRGRPPGTGARPRELRVCRRHGLVPFAHYRAGKEGFRWRCIRCVGEAVTRRNQKVRRILIEEAGGACAVCGYRRASINLHFHHVDADLKSFDMHSGTGKSIAALRAEARKCVLVCANCHGEIEAGVIPSPPPASRFTGSSPTRPMGSSPPG